MNTVNDERISLIDLTASKTLLLRNAENNIGELFEVIGEQGRGGSCIVYRALKLLKNDQKRPVLLKEFYPVDFSRDFTRNPTTGALCKEDTPLDDADQNSYEKQKKQFIEICNKQQSFFLQHLPDADELVEIQGLFFLGDSCYVMMGIAGGNSWDQIHEESVYQVFETALSILKELKVYHDSNLLHCDLKPANIYIFRKTRQHIRILDFGSVQELKNGMLSEEAFLSYSKSYTAPEIINAIGREDIDRYDYYSCISTAADLYSVAAILYKKLTGAAAPENMPGIAREKRISEDLNKLSREQNARRLLPISEKLAHDLSSFFNVMLSLNPDERYNIKEMEKHLRLFCIHVRPPEKLLSPVHRITEPQECFLGREREFEMLAELFDKGHQTIMVWGEGGVGKSEFVREYAWLSKDEYDFFWTSFSGNLEQTIIELQTEPLYSYSKSEKTDRMELYYWNLECLRNYKNTAVLIIDDCDPYSDENESIFDSRAYSDLRQLEIRVIFTCRVRPAECNAAIELKPLNEDTLLKIMNYYYPDTEQVEVTRKLINTVQKNTLIVVQVAKILRQSWGALTTEKMLEHFERAQKNDDTYNMETETEQNPIFACVRQLFSISSLSDCSKKILACSVLFPSSGVSAEIFLRCHEEPERDRIQILTMCGWLKKTATNLLSMHPLIREVCLAELKEQLDTCCDSFLSRYYDEFSKLDKNSWMLQRFQRMAIASNAADILSDPNGKHAERAGDYHYQEGFYSQALKNYQSFWEHFLNQNAQPPTLEAMRIMDRIANSAYMMGLYQHAVYYESSAISIAENKIGEGKPDMFPYYMNMGNIYMASESLEQAANYYKKAEQICDDYGSIRDKAYLYMNLSKLYERRRNLEMASNYTDKAIELARNNAEISPDWLASMFETLAAIYHRRGKHLEELACCKNAIILYEKYYGTDHERTAASHINEASALMSLQRYEEAYETLISAIELMLDTVGENHPHSAKAAYVLAQICCLRGDLLESKRWCEKALRAEAVIMLPAETSFGIYSLWGRLTGL